VNDKTVVESHLEPQQTHGHPLVILFFNNLSSFYLYNL